MRWGKLSPQLSIPSEGGLAEQHCSTAIPQYRQIESCWGPKSRFSSAGSGLSPISTVDRACDPSAGMPSGRAALEKVVVGIVRVWLGVRMRMSG